MLKRLIYVFIVAITLQFSWGVASAYCMHETGKASQHFGHHQHDHKASNMGGDAEQSSPAKKTSAHLDCASCSHHGSLGTETWQHSPAQAALLAAPIAELTVALPLPYLGLLERPRWNRAA